MRIADLKTPNSQLSTHNSPLFSVWFWALLLVGMAVMVRRGDLIAFDRAITQWMEALRMPLLDAAARAITFLGSSPWTLSIAILMSVGWVRARHWAMLAAFVAAGGLGLALQVWLRYWVGQWRPDVVTLPSALDVMARYHLAGFASGHAFRSAFLYGWWGEALQQRRAGWAQAATVGCGLLVFLVGASRIYLHRHWCTDVVGGWLIAMTVLAMTRPIRQQPSVAPHEG
ncbi:MAG: phosphatase PAP2 family protein [Candidatus Omnitrophica bacterium]|nr:phosphatase PAP2 family protein [Candidatus Omnitrophota bacterium]